MFVLEGTPRARAIQDPHFTVETPWPSFPWQEWAESEQGLLGLCHPGIQSFPLLYTRNRIDFLASGARERHLLFTVCKLSESEVLLTTLSKKALGQRQWGTVVSEVASLYENEQQGKFMVKETVSMFFCIINSFFKMSQHLGGFWEEHTILLAWAVGQWFLLGPKFNRQYRHVPVGHSKPEL